MPRTQVTPNRKRLTSRERKLHRAQVQQRYHHKQLAKIGSKPQSRAGRPCGSKADTPREGTRSWWIVAAFNNGFRWRSLHDLFEYVNLTNGFADGGVSSKGTISHVLNRWAPGWRDVMVKNGG